MSDTKQTSIFSATEWYRRAMRLHSAIPFNLMPSGRAFPAWHYFFEVTRRCNLRCKMCQYREWFERNPAGELLEGELTTDEWKGLVDQTGRFSLITFTGGEPWVRQDFLDILEYASTHRRTHVITNGVMLNEDRVRACVDLAPRGLTGKGFCFLGTSIDGLKDTHDAIRGRDDAFESTLENVRLMADLRDAAGKRFPMIHVTTVIQDENLEELPGLPEVVAKAGANVLNLTMEIRIHSIEGLGDVDPETLCTSAEGLPRLNPGRLDKYIEATLEAAHRAGIEVRLPDMPRSQVLKYHDGGLNLEEFTCRGVWTNFYVGALGDVYPCFIYKVGNVRENRLKELWNGPKMRAFRQRLRLEPFCLCQGCCHLEYAGPPKRPSVHQRPGTRPGDGEGNAP